LKITGNSNSKNILSKFEQMQQIIKALSLHGRTEILKSLAEGMLSSSETRRYIQDPDSG